MTTIHVETPLWVSPSLGEAVGSRVLLKMEALQPTGSFKVRGMGAACQASHAQGTRRVVCASGGNAGYAVAYAGQQLDMEVTIVVPITTPDLARERIRRQGATVLVHGATWDDAHEHATQLARQPDSNYIHPFDDPLVWHGHATMIHEVAHSGVKPETTVVAVGGGGLLCGVLQGLHAVGWSDVPVVAVETEGASSFAQSVHAGHLVTLDAIDSLATSLGARRVTAEALAWTEHHEIVPWIVSDRQAVDACLRFADDHRVLVEPACGAALAAVYTSAAPLAGRELVLVIVCGGAGVSRELLQKWDRQAECVDMSTCQNVNMSKC